MFSLHQIKSTPCIHRPSLVSPPLLLRQSRSVWKLPWKRPWKLPFKIPRKLRNLRTEWDFSPFEPIPEEPKTIKLPRAKPFDPDRKAPHSHREEEEDNWVATPMNGSIPVIAVVVTLWALSEKWMRTLPSPNDGQFGPMRYAGDPRAKYWGNYRRDIQPRQGRRHYDRGL